MSSLREAAQQALEALMDDCLVKVGPHSWERRSDLAITALRAALAEPVQEPVAWLWQHRETGRTRLLMPNERTATDVAYAWDVVGPLYLAPPQRKPLTEEEIIDIGKEARAVEGPHILPVAWESSEDGRTIQNNDFTHDVVLRVTGDFENDKQRISYAKRVVDKLNAPALAEPVQEPVAWLFTNLQSGDYDFCYQEDEHDHDREMWHKQPLYAAPPQRKPLTEDEILSLFRTSGSPVLFARAIERAHGIGDSDD